MSIDNDPESKAESKVGYKITTDAKPATKLKLLYIDRNKGKFFTSIGILLIIIYLIALIVINIANLFNPLVIPTLELVEISFLGFQFGVFSMIKMLILFLIFMIFLGYFEGILKSFLLVVFVFYAYFRNIEQGGFLISISVDYFSFYLQIDLFPIFLIIIILSFWMLFWEGVIYLFRSGLFSSHYSKEAENTGPIQPKQQPLMDDSKNQMEISNNQMEISKNQIENSKNKKNKVRQKHLQGVKELKKRPRSYLENKWVDRENETVILEDDEIPLRKEWIELSSDFRDSAAQFYFWNMLVFVVFSIIYATITYYLEEYNLKPPYNQTFEALFFVIWIIIGNSYKSHRHYIRAIGYISFSMVIQYFLYRFGIISSEGVFLLSYIIPVFRLFFIDLSLYFDSLGALELILEVSRMIGIVMLTMLAVLIIYTTIKHLKGFYKLEFFITNKNIYVRTKRRFNDYSFFKDVLTLLLYSYNPFNYIIFFVHIRYRQMAFQEGWNYDYGKLNYAESIRNLTKSINSRAILIIEIILLITAGVVFLDFYIGYGFLFWALFLISKTRYKSATMRIKFRRWISQGSIFAFYRQNTIKIFNVPLDIAEIIPSVSFYDTIPLVKRIWLNIKPRKL